MLGPPSPAGFTGPGLGPHPLLATLVPQLLLLQATTGYTCAIGISDIPT